MTKIELERTEFEGNVRSAKDVVNSLSNFRLTANHIQGTTLKPFTSLIQIEKQLDQLVRNYSESAKHTTEDFDRVSKIFGKTDKEVGQSIQKLEV